MKVKTDNYYTVLFILSFLFIANGQMAMPGKMEVGTEKTVMLKSENDSSITVIDSRGETVIIKKHPKRVLPIYTTYLNLWYECGGTAVGRPTAGLAQLPEDTWKLPVTGHVTTPDLEKILSLKSDLILLRNGFPGHSRIIPMLSRLNIPFFSIKYDNFADYLALADIFSRLTGRDDIRIDSLPKIKSEVDRLIASVTKLKSPKVLILFGSSMGVIVKLPDSFVGSMIRELGGKNIAYDAKLTSDDMQIFSMERIIEKDPDIILIQTMGKQEMVKRKIDSGIESNPAWKTITAVKNRRVYYLPIATFLYKPNKEFPKSYRYLAKLLYGDSFVE